MGSDTKAKPDLYLKVTESREYGYFHIQVSVCTLKFENHEWTPAGIDDGYESGPKLSDLRIRCQGDDSSQRHESREQAVYGYEPVFEDVRPSLRDCRRMLKTLEMIDRGFTKIEETRGAARTFAAYVGRLGEVLKVKGMIHERTARQRKYDERRWDTTNLGEGVRAIDNRIWQWQQEAVRAEPAPASETEVAS